MWLWRYLLFSDGLEPGFSESLLWGTEDKAESPSSVKGQDGDDCIKAGEPKSNSLKKISWEKPTLPMELRKVNFIGTLTRKQTCMSVGQI